MPKTFTIAFISSFSRTGGGSSVEEGNLLKIICRKKEASEILIENLS